MGQSGYPGRSVDHGVHPRPSARRAGRDTRLFTVGSLVWVVPCWLFLSYVAAALAIGSDQETSLVTRPFWMYFVTWAAGSALVMAVSVAIYQLASRRRRRTHGR